MTVFIEFSMQFDQEQSTFIWDRSLHVYKKPYQSIDEIRLLLSSILNDFFQLLKNVFSLKSTDDKASKPIDEGSFQDVTRGKVKEKHQSTHKVIIADDSPSIQFYYESLLSRYNIELLMAEDGCEVLQLCQAHDDIDVILMDIRMPGMDGPTALKELRKFNKEVRVVGQSAFTSEEQIETFKNEGFDEYLVKPIDEETLIKVLKLNE